ncbi:glycosyl transferase [Histomonas meleagridis]|uniref:glycosyl transferase n=1 Tax=Histomonas meleagridis TaxID=135588 RepID=UPI0035594036|nr:glycosyl transferase [Histomonas meleagridis]KAH0798108.1 glycosyl transferase [Histomonas meleagridis]
MLFLICLITSSISTFRDDQAVSLSIVAPWGNVSLFHQIYAFLVRYSAEYAKEFLMFGAQNIEKIDDEKLVWKSVEKIIPYWLKPILKTNIEVGSQVPRAIFNGDDIGSCKSSTFRIYETDLVQGNPTTITCVNLRTDSKKILNLLKSDKSYAIRLIPDKIDQKSNVRGYGIEMRPFKYSMEYGVKDSFSEDKESAEPIGIIDETQKHLPEDIDDNISNLNLTNFDAKFTHYLGTQNIPLPSIMRDISENWPLYMKAISTQEIPPVNEYEKFRYYVDEGASFSILNGRVLPKSDMDTFTFLDILDEESILRNVLQLKFNLSDRQINTFVYSELPNTSNIFFDYNSNCIDFYNDIETEKFYSKWDLNIEKLHNAKTVMPQIRKNLVNIILYIDPSTPKGIVQLFSAVILVRNGFPIRVGLVPYFNLCDTLSRKIAFAYHSLAQVNVEAAINFLIRSYNGHETDEITHYPIRFNETIFANSYEIFAAHYKLKTWNNLNEHFSLNSEVFMRIKRNTNYLKRVGIKIGSVSINGEIIKKAPKKGHCLIENTNKAAKGLKLKIIPSKIFHNSYYQNHYLNPSETFVMKDFAYFQLMGTIGVNEITNGNEMNELIEVNTYASRRHRIEVKENKAKTFIKAKNSSRVDIFAVASGHLYERLMKIMMLSVKRQTNSSVTFWILNNFLSPQFKAVLHQMADRYGFKYVLVKYKWPYWINKQVEKQRIIWGNKILFLDVLFPPELDRVIYVDSDQIVRTDMNELMKMDFNGAPYAFTPFCDSRPETEPFRFWKNGFWANHLGNKKYHISALFAIDLKRFREMGAADVLRHYYQSLSLDKDSLANLDQDLPNYVQSIIPIYSLQQNWLWCETWCSDETMDQAKTIDLCNNPYTKIPKLMIAQKRVKEWPGLDEEARKIKTDDDTFKKFFFV